MFLSRMALDVTKRKTMQALGAPNLFHGAIESSFPGERQRNLWRVDQLNGQYYLLILSSEKPDLEEAVKQFAPDGETWMTKEYDPFLERIQNNTMWHFRLTANPTYSKSNGEKPRGKVHAYYAEEDQRKWLIRQSQLHGFQVGEKSFEITQSKWYHFNKASGKNRVSMLAVTYEGFLQVLDENAFRKVMVNGIGREKAYGMGLMTLVRIKER